MKRLIIAFILTIMTLTAAHADQTNTLGEECVECAMYSFSAHEGLKNDPQYAALASEMYGQGKVFISLSYALLGPDKANRSIKEVAAQIQSIRENNPNNFGSYMGEKINQCTDSIVKKLEKNRLRLQ